MNKKDIKEAKKKCPPNMGANHPNATVIKFEAILDPEEFEKYSESLGQFCKWYNERYQKNQIIK